MVESERKKNIYREKKEEEAVARLPRKILEGRMRARTMERRIYREYLFLREVSRG